MTGGPGKEYRTNKPPSTRRSWERMKGDATCPTTSQNPPCCNPSWLNNACSTGRTLSQNHWPETAQKLGPLPTVTPEAGSLVAEQLLWAPLPCHPPPWHLFPIKSLALSAHASPQTVLFGVLDKNPLSGPGRGPPSYNIFTFLLAYLIHSLLCIRSTSLHLYCIFSVDD